MISNKYELQLKRVLLLFEPKAYKSGKVYVLPQRA